MNRRRSVLTGWLLGTLLTIVGVAYAPNAAATQWVANYGADVPGCGSSQTPCRSISQAIENASDNEVIWVGPGRYGDVDGDGSYTSLGDEHASQPGFGLDGCIVCIGKRV